ncbi:MAG: hypothetical protein HC915_04810 [Anaerolineae bacterium]|nr:hypothetical protein [Anaerolineae bacterium]
MDQNLPRPDDQSSDPGMNPYELPNLPEPDRQVLQVILRKREMSYSDLVDYVKRATGINHVEVDELDTILEGLSQKGHILAVFEGEETIYKANLRHKSGRNLMIKGIWDVLESASEEVDEARSGRRRQTGGLADKLFPTKEGSPAPKSEEKGLANPDEGGKQLAASIFEKAQRSKDANRALADSLFGNSEAPPRPEKPAPSEPIQPRKLGRGSLANALFGKLDKPDQDDAEPEKGTPPPPEPD